MIFGEKESLWIMGLGIALITASLVEINHIQFVGVVFLTRGLIGMLTTYLKYRRLKQDIQ